jgi:hypothetical protein
MKKGTKSTTDGQASSSHTQTPPSKVRKHSEISPDLEDLTIKKHCQDSIEMNEELANILKEMRAENANFIKEMRAEYSMLNEKIDELSRKFDVKLEKMEEDMKEIQEDVINAKNDITALEEKSTELDDKVGSISTELNILNQIMLQDQLVMVNIATSIDEDRFIESLHKWTDNIIKNSLASIKLTTNEKLKSKSAFMKFTSFDNKKIFLDFIKKKQKKEQNYVPILNEDIFELPDSDVNRADIIEFRTPMTSMNRDIFKAAREARKVNKSIEGVWISKGAVQMRIRNVKKPQQINSIEHIKAILSSFPLEKAKATNRESPMCID